MKGLHKCDIIFRVKGEIYIINIFLLYKVNKMGLFDKLSNLIYENPDDDNNSEKKKKSWTDVFFESDSQENTSSASKKSWTDIFFEDSEKPAKKKKGLVDFLFEDEPEDGVKSTFVEDEKRISALDDIPSQIEKRESELINLAEFFKAVNSEDYPDSGPEYEAYISLVKQLRSLKEISESSQDGFANSMARYQLEDGFKRFEKDYNSHIGAIKTLCYLSEVATLNSRMIELFGTEFTDKTDHKLEQIDDYITLISGKRNSFDKKYSTRLLKELVEAEYRLTLLKLMNEIRCKRAPRSNPFADFSSQKRSIFETYLSKDIRDSSEKYNSIAESREKYTKYGNVDGNLFDKLDTDAEVIAEEINEYTIDDFAVDELLEDGEGYETLKRFLRFKLVLNFIDSKTEEANRKFLDENYRKASSGSSKKGKKKKDKQFPDFDEDL